MPKSVTQYDLLISCPGDITDELAIIEECVKQFNNTFSDVLDVSIRTKHWSINSFSQSGDKPQSLLNKQFVRDCDAAVAIFWTRFGTPTDEYGSGTEEEISIMLESGKQVFMYFSDKPLPPSLQNSDEYNRVNAFRKKYKEKGLYFTYQSDNEFKKLFFAHLSQFFLGEKRGAHASKERNPILKLMGIDRNGFLREDAEVIQFVPQLDYTDDQYRKEIIDLYRDIAEIHLCKRSDVGSIYSFSKPVDIKESSRNILVEIAGMLGFYLPDDFFQLGNLRKNVTLDFDGSNSYTGTPEEKKKYALICNLLKKVNDFSAWVAIETAFMGKKHIKLALQNVGTDIDEDIEISLEIPENALLLIDDFPAINNQQQGYLLNNCGISNMFGIHGSADYMNYEASVKNSHPSIRPSSFQTPGKTVQNYKADFIDELRDVFCYSTYFVNGKVIVKLKVDYIKHNTCVAFPSVLFLTENVSEIPYKITSKNSTQIFSGIIKIFEES